MNDEVTAKRIILHIYWQLISHPLVLAKLHVANLCYVLIFLKEKVISEMWNAAFDINTDDTNSPCILLNAVHRAENYSSDTLRQWKPRDQLSVQ